MAFPSETLYPEETLYPGDIVVEGVFRGTIEYKDPLKAEVSFWK